VIAIYAKTKNSMVKETGISSSVDENDVKSYLQEILEEVKVEKRRKKERICDQVFCQYPSMLIVGKFLQYSRARQIDKLLSNTSDQMIRTSLRMRVQYDLY
jgi:hypothetical protein